MGLQTLSTTMLPYTPPKYTSPLEPVDRIEAGEKKNEETKREKQKFPT